MDKSTVESIKVSLGFNRSKLIEDILNERDLVPNGPWPLGFFLLDLSFAVNGIDNYGETMQVPELAKRYNVPSERIHDLMSYLAEFEWLNLQGWKLTQTGPDSFKWEGK